MTPQKPDLRRECRRRWCCGPHARRTSLSQPPRPHLSVRCTHACRPLQTNQGDGQARVPDWCGPGWVEVKSSPQGWVWWCFWNCRAPREVPARGLGPAHSLPAPAPPRMLAPTIPPLFPPPGRAAAQATARREREELGGGGEEGRGGGSSGGGTGREGRGTCPHQKQEHRERGSKGGGGSGSSGGSGSRGSGGSGRSSGSSSRREEQGREGREERRTGR